MRSLSHNGQAIFDPSKILNTQADYFAKLYTETSDKANNVCGIKSYLHNINLPNISNTSKEYCDNGITFEEVSKAVKELANNKTPGPDGIPGEFYKLFWSDIGHIVFDSFRQAYENGELPNSQKQGIINLIPKKDKDLTDLKSWRPLSILNTDYKILTKVLGNRLKTVLQDIISTDQVGYMKNRYCGENIKLISDVIEYCKLYNHPCYIFLADFEKAFDTVNLTFLMTALKSFGFGPKFTKWISIIYTNIESCVTNNGYLSSYFKLSRGIRQVCPISALLFLIVAEVVATIFRQSECVRGMNIKRSTIKLCQLADDMTLFLADINSVKLTFTIFEEFYRYAGLKLNKKKTEVFSVNTDMSYLQHCTKDVNWTDKPFKTLGMWFSSNIMETIHLNTSHKINIIKSIIKSWQPRPLSIKGKITVVKSLIIPHLL